MSIDEFEERMNELLDEARMSLLTENDLEDILSLKVQEMAGNRERFFASISTFLEKKQ